MLFTRPSKGWRSVPWPRAVSYLSSSTSPFVPYMSASMASRGRSFIGVVSLKRYFFASAS